MRKSAVAHISKEQGDRNLNVIFYHPVLKDNKNPSKKRRIRRTLATKDVKEASLKVETLNQLITNDYWHDISRKQEAEEKFGELITYIFYEDMENPSKAIIKESINKLKQLQDVDTQLLSEIIDRLHKLSETVVELS